MELLNKQQLPLSTEEQQLTAISGALDIVLGLDEPEPMASCDVCGGYVPADEISTGWVYGLETSACRDCTGRDDT